MTGPSRQRTCNNFFIPNHSETFGVTGLPSRVGGHIGN